MPKSENCLSVIKTLYLISKTEEKKYIRYSSDLNILTSLHECNFDLLSVNLNNISNKIFYKH